MSNETTVITPELTVEELENLEVTGTSTQSTRVTYDEVLCRASQREPGWMEDLQKRLAGLHGLALSFAFDEEKGALPKLRREIAKGSTRPWKNADVCKVLQASYILYGLKDHAAWLAERDTEPEQFERFIDHHILYQPTMLRLTPMDMYHLITGTREKVTLDDGRVVITSHRGIERLEHANFGVLHATPTGFLLRLNGQDIALSGEWVHGLLTRSLPDSRQPVPFTNACVMAKSLSDEETKRSKGQNLKNFQYDGMTCVVPAGFKFLDADGVLWELEADTRFSMPYSFYQVMYIALLGARYPDHFGEQQFKRLGKALVSCNLGRTDRKQFAAPSDEVEVDMVHRVGIYQNWDTERQAKAFGPRGMLDGYKTTDLSNPEAYRASYQAAAEAREARRTTDAELTPPEDVQVFNEPALDDVE